MSEMSCDDDGHSSKSSIRYVRDLRKEYEIYIRTRLETFDIEKIFDVLIKDSVVPGNFLELLECSYRYSILKGFIHESPILKKYLDGEKCGCNGFYDYLECITIINYVISKRSFSCLFI